MKINTGHTPVLYHGTSAHRAALILVNGFRRAVKQSYTGSGICLSEHMTISYEYGAYEQGGRILEIRLNSQVHWIDAGVTVNDELFARDGVEAARSYGGNVWVIWNPACIADVRLLNKSEAVKLLAEEIQQDGGECAYNGVVQDYANALFSGATGLQADAALTRSLRRAGVAVSRHEQ